jgi:hypothetical protein
MVVTLDEWAALGIGFVSATEVFDTSSAQGRLLMHLVSAFSSSTSRPRRCTCSPFGEPPEGRRRSCKRGAEPRSLASGAAPVYGHRVTWWCRLAAVFLVVAAVVYPHRASAATAVQLETRVRGIELVVHALVGGSSSPNLEKHRGSAAAYDEIAPGYSLAEGCVFRRT